MLPDVPRSNAELVSYAPDHSDVVVLRALGDPGHYVETTPVPDLTRALADRGWRGTVVLPAGADAGDRGDRRHEATVATPRAVVGPVHVAVAAADDDVAPLAPWLALVASDPADRTRAEGALETAGYVPGVFDGSYRFWVSPDHLDLLPAVSYPASARDGYVPAAEARLRADRAELRAAVRRWRAQALTAWAGGELAPVARASTADLDAARAEAAHWRQELAATHRTLSWRVTRPLRAVRRRAR